MNDIIGEYGETKIKELIEKFPGIIEVLKEFQIDCVYCKQRNCRLSEIAERETINMNDEIEFMDKIAAVMAP